MSTVYLNGVWVAQADATVSVEDRGFLLADGVYEVTPFYQGVAFCLDRHLARLERSLAALRIDLDPSGLRAVHGELIERNGLESAERALVYLQVTRGAAPRTHYFPEGPIDPTVYAFAKAWSRPAEDDWNRGFSAATVTDDRWHRVDIKSISLLPNVLAFQNARDTGADDALFVRDGVAIEGAHQNFFGVFSGTIVTHPEGPLILSGITRSVVLELARGLGLPVEERPINVEELPSADELFFTGTTGEVRPCVEVDGRPVGGGDVGTVTRTLSDAFLERVRQTREAAAAVTP